jgi:superfamily II DNA or RNA helicase
MKQFPDVIKFKYTWRKYQQRVLDELDEHLNDNHLHIIAPPGSGKTVLGLEVILRLDKPTLVLAPTLAIRNQWVQRFCELFLQVDQEPEWISRDINKPKLLTVSTYQGLYAACNNLKNGEEDPEEPVKENRQKKTIRPGLKTKGGAKEIIKLLLEENIGTIVMDEAHHLKNAWWKSIIKIKKAIEPVIVGLTATPPYDVSHLEWQRYIELNGPVDAEISVPELILEGDLCPHQDLLMLSLPTRQENMKIEDFRRRIQKLFNEIQTDSFLISSLEQHPFFKYPLDHLKGIYSEFEEFLSMLIFLQGVGKEITREHFKVIGVKSFSVPELTFEWLETLLTFYLFKGSEHFNNCEEHQEKLINKLKRNQALERRTINFSDNKKVNKSLGTSISKLESIEKIVRFEHQQLKHNLRMVILSDYIRKEFFISQSENNLELNKIGVLPIFEKLRRSNKNNIRIAVLTGSMIIIPLSALETFKKISLNSGIEKISTSPLPFDSQYLLVNITEKLKHDIVSLITQIFQLGQIEVLVGTKSLLGEGWDAPAINSLILASFVGSYVLSNQMRGRAIRAERLNPEKTSNIWHLVCVDPSASDGGDDFCVLEKRFKAFVGVSLAKEPCIANGIGRLNLPEKLVSGNEISQLNQGMIKIAASRDQLNLKWKQALLGGVSLVEEIKIPFPCEHNYKEEKSLYYNKTIAYMFAVLGSGIFTFSQAIFEEFLYSLGDINTIDDILDWAMLMGGCALLGFGLQLFKTLRIYIKYRDISKDLHHIAEALLETLSEANIIQTIHSQLNIVSEVDDSGGIYCHLDGGTTYEKSVFIKSLQEIIGKIDNPKYLIIRQSIFLKLFLQKDYHAVPEVIGRRKESANCFQEQWKLFVGNCKLVYTRNLKGRKMLVKSRMNSLSSEFEDRSERVNIWR